MELYHVLLVDDEEEVIQAIIKKLDWEALGFQVVGYAENGQEAFEMAQRLCPDVIMTDIKMPFMDGLTLCKKVKEFNRGVRFVIFSGFDEFEYAKESIKLEVEEYILKPINSLELRSVFQRIRINLDREIQEKRNVEKLRKYYQDSLPIMGEQFLLNLLEGRVEEEKINELMEFYELDLNGPEYMVSIFKTESSEGESSIQKSQLESVSLKEIVEDNLKDLCRCKVMIYLETVVALTIIEQSQDKINLIDRIEQICNLSKRILGTNTAAGIGRNYKIISEAQISYQEAKNALGYRVLQEANQAIYIEDIEPCNGEEVKIDRQLVENILNGIKVGKKEELEEAIKVFVNQLKNSQISLYQYQLLLMEMIAELAKLGRSYQLEIEQIFGARYHSYYDILEIDSIDTLNERLKEICMEIKSSIGRERKDGARLIADKAKEYIKDNYHNPELSVDVICRYLGLSAAYFSTVFKREVGVTFIMYLTKIRMEQALLLLNTTEDKTYIISSKVGYLEPNYFSYVFKKHYGISPSAYRTNRGNHT